MSTLHFAPFTKFGQTKNVPVAVYLDGWQIESDWWTESLWVERGEDWYALMSSGLKGKRVRVIEARHWRRAKPLAVGVSPDTDSSPRVPHAEPCLLCEPDHGAGFSCTSACADANEPRVAELLRDAWGREPSPTEVEAVTKIARLLAPAFAKQL